MMSSHVAFDSPVVLAQALSMCWNTSPFPSKVVELDDGRLAAPANGFSGLDHVGAQHGWRLELVATEKEPTMKLASLVGGTWSRRDPLRWQGPMRAQYETVYRSDAPGQEYLLAARDRGEAKLLLDRLTGHLADDIRIIAVEFQQAQPYAFFWLVTGRVPLDVLDAAPRAWWGPAGSARRVFLQWPLSLRVPESFLQRITWDEDSGLVLLSQDAPNLLIVRMPVGASLGRPMEDFGELVPVESHSLEMSNAAVITTFPVRLRLARSTPRDVDRERDRFSNEIEVLQHRMKFVRGQLDRLFDENPDGRIIVSAPLLFFYSEHESVVPNELRRLLIEWSNQPGDLESLAYGRLDVTQLPLGLDQPYEALHVVTPMAAIGRPTPSGAPPDPTLNARLLSYAGLPLMLGAQPRFQALEEWHDKGLRLFVPQDFAFELYPRLVPSTAAADKLAHALFNRPISRTEREHVIMLLVGSGSDTLTACSIETTAFKPLAEAIDWACSVNIDPLPAITIAEIKQHAKQAFVNGLTHSMDVGFMAEEKNALGKVVDDMRRRMELDATLVEDHEKTVNSLRKVLGGLDEHWTTVRPALDQVRVALATMQNALAQITAPVPELDTAIAWLKAAAKALDTERQALEGERQALEQEQRKMRNPPKRKWGPS
jgi:hypothetical protein